MGAVAGKDYLCVQSIDGQLSFFEQDAFAFARPLVNQLVPGAMAYVAKIDSIVLATPRWKWSSTSTRCSAPRLQP